MKQPFLLSRQRCGLIMLFKSRDIDALLDVGACNGEIDFAASAKAMLDGLEDWWCVAFLEALRDECRDRIIKHDAEVERFSAAMEKLGKGEK